MTGISSQLSCQVNRRPRINRHRDNGIKIFGRVYDKFNDDDDDDDGTSSGKKKYFSRFII